MIFKPITIYIYEHFNNVLFNNFQYIKQTEVIKTKYIVSKYNEQTRISENNEIIEEKIEEFINAYLIEKFEVSVSNSFLYKIKNFDKYFFSFYEKNILLKLYNNEECVFPGETSPSQKYIDYRRTHLRFLNLLKLFNKTNQFIYIKIQP